MARLAACFLLSVALAATVAIEISPPILPAENRITFGTPASPGQLPYMACILSEAPKKPPLGCAGSLIKRHAVLTSALCTHNYSKFTVRLGSILRTATDPNAWNVVSTWVVVHPKYNDDNFDNNIAIIFLPNIAPLNEFIQPVDLPSPRPGSFIGSLGVVSGWGYTDPGSGMSELLRWAEVLVISNDVCKKAYTNYGLLTSDRQLCAGAATSTVYYGDWGAPLVIKIRGRYRQIGLLSNLSAYGYNSSLPALYTRVTAFMDWIRRQTAYRSSDTLLEGTHRAVADDSSLHPHPTI